MKRFSYSLQALLTLRLRAEQRSMERYAVTLAERQKARDELMAVQRAQVESWSKWNDQLSHGCLANALAQSELCHRRLAEKREVARMALERAESSVGKSMQDMLLARREREAVEKHMGRKRAEYDYEAGRHNQNALDDLRRRAGPLPVISGAANGEC